MAGAAAQRDEERAAGCLFAWDRGGMTRAVEGFFFFLAMVAEASWMAPMGVATVWPPKIANGSTPRLAASPRALCTHSTAPSFLASRFVTPNPMFTFVADRSGTGPAGAGDERAPRGAN